MTKQYQVLGTIIATVLNYDQLCSAIGEEAIVHPKKSTYAPCDGRSVAGSKLAILTDKAAVPDLRGKFLRGLNLMYNPGQPLPFDPNINGNPQPNLTAGDFQEDAIIQHTHSYTMFNDGKIYDMSDDKDKRLASYGNNIAATTGSSGNASETRPRNISVYFYIKIN